MRAATILIAGALASLPADVIDRTAAVVGQAVVTESDVERQLRLEAMFNDRQPDLSPAARRRALQRLIEQRLLERDMTLAGYATAEDEELLDELDQIRAQQFADMSFERALEHYGLTKEIVLGFIRRQIDYQGYVRFRFQTGLAAADEEIAREYKRLYPEAKTEPPPELEEEIRARLVEEKAARLVDARIKQLRAETRIVILDRIEPDEKPETEATP